LATLKKMTTMAMDLTRRQLAMQITLRHLTKV
jgi:hypothetical protein